MRPIQKLLIEKSTGKKYFVKDLDEDFHTSQGIIKSLDLKKGGLIYSSKKIEFYCLELSFPDRLENIQRGPQAIIQKDIGLILAKTGINKDSKVVDAGGGSGSLAFSLANVGREITVYEINPEHFDLLSRNVKLFDFKNITLKQADVCQGISEKELGLITLDLPEPWRVIEHAESSLKEGGFLVVYLPNLTQVKQFIDSARKTKIKVLETVELLERKWKIEGQIMRPEFEMLGHTGFLTFCRRLGG